MNNHQQNLITFEGIDFCGKSTQIKILEKKLLDTGYKVLVLRDPGGNIISEKIREILLDKKNMEMVQETEVLLYEAARAQMTAQKVIPFLEEGGFVLLDRFYDSTLAYQGYGRGIKLDTIKTLNSFASRNLIPAITFFLDISLNTFNLRLEKSGNMQDRLESSGEDFFKEVKAGYYKIYENEPERIKAISADENIESVSREIWKYTNDKFNLI